MADAIARPSLFLREDEIRRGIELLYFGYGHLLRGADARLEQERLGRAHHRVLYFIARNPNLAVSDLLRLLGITKQSLSRVLGDLQGRGLVVQTVGPRDRRRRLLALTESGRALENDLFEALQDRMGHAYAQAGEQAIAGFWAVLAGLIPAADLLFIRELQSHGR